MHLAAQSARHRSPALARVPLCADIFPICVLDIPVKTRQRLGVSAAVEAADFPSNAASKLDYIDALSRKDLMNFVRTRGWDASSGGHIRLSGQGRTTEAIRSELAAKLNQEQGATDPEIKVLNDGVVYATSASLIPWHCMGWVDAVEPPAKVSCTLVAEVLQKKAMLQDMQSARWSKWGSFEIQLARCFSFRGLLIGGQPCIAVLLSHKAVPPPELNLAELCSASNPDRVLGLEVRSIGRRAFGTVVGCAGLLGENGLRAELLALSTCENMRDAISNASDYEACWRVRLSGGGKRIFTYLASQLQPLLTFSNLEALDRVMGHSVSSNLARDSCLEPSSRQRLVEEQLDRLHKVVPDIAAKLFPAPPARLSSELLDRNFTHFSHPRIVVGGGKKVQPSGGNQVWSALRANGLYRYAPEIGRHLELRGYVLGSASKDEVEKAGSNFEELVGLLRQVDLKISVGHQRVQVARSVRSALNRAGDDGAHAVVLFAASGAGSWYYKAKTECLNRTAPGLSHLACQWIKLSRKGHQRPALLNMALQLCAKVGHTPYVADSAQAGRDHPVLCGVDVCHLRAPQDGRMEHVIAGLQLRRGNGEVEHSWVCQGKIQGESIPASVWETIVSKEACAGREVVIHRDGRFTEQEKRFLANHAKDVGASGAFGLVEIVKYAAGTPRLYSGDKNAPAGSFMRLSDTEGILATGSCPRTGTRNPLLIRVVASRTGERPAISIETAAEDISRLSLLSYGSLYFQPRLPVTTKTADKAAYFHASVAVDQLASSIMGDAELKLISHGRQQYWL